MKGVLLMSAALLALVGGESGSARPAAHGSVPVATPRIVYSSDWSGTAQIYAVDPSGRSPTGQLTFGRAPACSESPTAPCGFRDPAPSPDGRKLLFWDFVAGWWVRRSLFVANADGTHRRRVAVAEGSVVAAVWAPDSTRLAYSDNRGIHVVLANGSGDRLLPTTTPGDHSPAWSPDGRSLAFFDPREHDAVWDLVVVTGSDRRVAVRAETVRAFAWAPAGRWIAFGSEGVNIVRPDGTGRRRVADGGGFSWSPDGRRLALAGNELRVYDVRSRAIRTVPDAPGATLWSPDGRLLAGRTAKGIALVDGRTGTTRLLTREVGERLSWAPDGRSLAYLWSAFAIHPLGKLELRVVGLRGETRAVVAAGDRYGGALEGAVWVRPPKGVRYRKPLARALAMVSRNELTAPWPISHLATDGDRVAYAACGHVFVWTPAAQTVDQAELVSSLSPWCTTQSDYISYRAYTLALADNRVAYGTVYGGAHARFWWLGWIRAGARTTLPLDCELGSGIATGGGGPFRPHRGQIVGELAGSGSDLFYSSWGEAGTINGIATTTQQVLGGSSDACTGSSIRSSEGGPLVPLDADERRVVAAGNNETWVLDRSGAIVTRVPEPLVAAQLSGSDLVILHRGELRHYDAASGDLVHTHALPDVTTGRECGGPNTGRCYPTPRLVLEDVARGLVTYVVDGEVHLLRLSDGAHAVVAPGTLARFLDAGLVYADGSTLHFISFEQLPLR